MLNVEVMLLMEPGASLERNITVNITVESTSDNDPSAALMSFGMPC
jgi:hypothetical protein